MIGEIDVDTNTSGALQDRQITLTDLTVSTDEARNIRCVPITLGNADFPLPDPYVDVF